MVRRGIGGVIAGLVIGFAIVQAAEVIAHQLCPLAPGRTLSTSIR